MPTRSPTLAEVLRNAIDARLAAVRVALPARVESYDSSRQLVNVKPLLRESYTDENGDTVTDSLPVISNVPVVFPGAGGMRITFPIAKGDTVLLTFADRSLDTWLAKGGEVDPGEDARHSLSDAVAIPGLHDSLSPWSGASASDMTMGKDGGPQIVISSSAVKLGGSGAVDSAIKGTTYRVAEDILLTAVGTFATACGGALPALVAPATTLNTAIGTFTGAALSYVSPTVKVA